MIARGTIMGHFDVQGGSVRGFAYDAADLTRRLALELLLDGWPLDIARADDYAPEAADIGDGCYGFGFRLSEALGDAGSTLEVRVANTGETVGAAVSLAGGREGPTEAAGRIEWTGGLRLTGWVEPAALGASVRVRLVVERRTVVEAEARGFAAVRQGALRSMKARFDLRLPELFADGRVHWVTALDARGRDLAGSPCAVLCFADGLRSALLEKSHLVDGDPRAALIDRVLPRSVPFGDLEAWMSRQEAVDAVRPRRDATVAILMLGDEPDTTLASLGEQDHGAWLAIAAPPIDGPGTFDPAACRAALAAEPDLDAVLVLPAGARLRPGALQRWASLAGAGRGSVYGDALIGTSEGQLPLLWPAYDPERQLEQGYAALAFAAPAEAVSNALGRGASSSFALFDRLAAEWVPLHVPDILIELPRPDPLLGRALAEASRRNAGGVATPSAPDRQTGLPVVHLRRLQGGTRTAVAVIQPEPFVPELATISAALPGVAERIVVSHRPLQVPTGWRNVVLPGARNPSRLRNAVLEATDAAHCLLLDAGVEPEDGAVAAEMLGRFSTGTAAVGGLVLDEEGLVLSAGLVLGPSFDAVPAFVGLAPDADSYAGVLSVARSCGALDAAALLVDRAAALAAGGFDPLLFPEHRGSADFCLKLRREGGRLVLAPRARFVRRRAWRSSRSREGAGAELAALRRRWGRDLADDPYYHPGLNRDAAPFTALAWPPFPRDPRRPEPPKPILDPEMRR